MIKKLHLQLLYTQSNERDDSILGLGTLGPGLEILDVILISEDCFLNL